jgi:STE24 endopeptidase
VSNADVLTGTLLGAVGAAAGVALLGWLLTLQPLLRRAGADGAGDPRVIPLVLFLVAFGMLLTTPVYNLTSRHVEARADVHSLDLTADPATFVAMQQRLAETNLADPDPPAVWQWFFGNHPTTAERVAMAGDWVRLGRR